MAVALSIQCQTVSNIQLFAYKFAVSRAVMADLASQAAQHAPTPPAPGLIFGYQGSTNVHHCKLYCCLCYSEDASVLSYFTLINEQVSGSIVLNK